MGRTALGDLTTSVRVSLHLGSYSRISSILRIAKFLDASSATSANLGIILGDRKANQNVVLRAYAEDEEVDLSPK